MMDSGGGEQEGGKEQDIVRTVVRSVRQEYVLHCVLVAESYWPFCTH